MPPRSYYVEPRASDYLAFAKAFFPHELDAASEFVARTGLPYVASSTHISAYLGVSPSLVRQIIHKPDYHYRQFPLKKHDGSERVISTPRTYLKVIQWWILDNILFEKNLSSNVHGFRKGYSYISNAKEHIGARHILNVDVKSFFDSIPHAEISNVFSRLGYDEQASLVLTALTSCNGSAPTGAPTSPMIANLIFVQVDRQLAQFAAERGLIYTRYADDLTFSRSERIPAEYVEEVEGILGSAGFHLNKRKTRFMGRGDRQEVTGVVINSGLNMNKDWRNSARGFIHRVARDPAGHAAELDRLRGIYGILVQFDKDHDKRLTQAARDALHLLVATAASSSA